MMSLLINACCLGVYFRFVLSGYREQVNRLSSYIDGGMIYGDTKSFNENLSGKLGN